MVCVFHGASCGSLAFRHYGRALRSVWVSISPAHAFFGNRLLSRFPKETEGNEYLRYVSDWEQYAFVFRYSTRILVFQRSPCRSAHLVSKTPVRVWLRLATASTGLVRQFRRFLRSCPKVLMALAIVFVFGRGFHTRFSKCSFDTFMFWMVYSPGPTRNKNMCTSWLSISGVCAPEKSMSPCRGSVLKSYPGVSQIVPRCYFAIVSVGGGGNWKLDM